MHWIKLWIVIVTCFKQCYGISSLYRSYKFLFYSLYLYFRLSTGDIEILYKICVPWYFLKSSQKQPHETIIVKKNPTKLYIFSLPSDKLRCYFALRSSLHTEEQLPTTSPRLTFNCFNFQEGNWGESGVVPLFRLMLASEGMHREDISSYRVYSFCLIIPRNSSATFMKMEVCYIIILLNYSICCHYIYPLLCISYFCSICTCISPIKNI